VQCDAGFSPFTLRTSSRFQDTLYLHAGCPEKGRLATTHAFHIPSTTWTSLPSAPGPGRGGTVLASLPSHLGPSGRIGTFLRYGGFAGHELGHDNEGGLDAFVPEMRSWLSGGSEGDLSVGVEHPSRRSVHGMAGVDQKIEGTETSIRALLFYGESGPAPAELGHAGAGLFHSDVHALISTRSTPSPYFWQELPVYPSSPIPEPRGWLAAASWYDTDAKSWKVLMQGGLTQTNERLGDVWILDIVQE